VLDNILMSDDKVFRADLARSVRLFRAFRTEQTAPQAYYAALTIGEPGRHRRAREVGRVARARHRGSGFALTTKDGGM
jgi:hypothetical protein